MKKISVKTLQSERSQSSVAGVTATLCGGSKKMTGLSFISYVNERRLAVAAEALKKSNDKILSISQEAGFTNLSNFNRQFKSRYGVTPKEYREMTDI